MTRKVLVVGMFDSVHFARWLTQFQDQEIEFLLFPSSPHRRLHPKLKELLTNRGVARYSLAFFSRYYGLPFWLVDQVLGNLIRGSVLRFLISTFRPNYIHALEIQNAGYIALRALGSGKPKEAKLIVTNYGSDLFWFKKFPKHLEKIKRLLSIADVYSCECARDIELAQQLGFFGQVMPVIPNAGGFSEELLSQKLKNFSERRIIAVKGYHGWVGRAHVAIEALGQISGSLKNYEIVFYSCNHSTMRKAHALGLKTGLKIETYAKGQLPHSQVLNLFSNSAVYVGISESDGISTSLLEAMAMGAVPVQTATSCCDEWFGPESGVAIRSIDPGVVAEGILNALELARDGEAAYLNQQTIKSKASEQQVREAALNFYR
jgi:glycosyltransferase involved in cell wall biosynthesis